MSVSPLRAGLDDAKRAASTGAIADADEVKRFLTQGMRGEIAEKKTTSTGETYDAVTIKERRECAALLAKLEGWIGDDGKQEEVKPKVGVWRPTGGAT